MTYLRGSFFVDLVAMVPFVQIVRSWDNKELFYLLKLIRLHNGFALLDYKQMVKELKQFQQKRLQRLIEYNPI